MLLPGNLVDVRWHLNLRLEPAKTTPILCSHPQGQPLSLAKTSQGSEFKFVGKFPNLTILSKMYDSSHSVFWLFSFNGAQSPSEFHTVKLS